MRMFWPVLGLKKPFFTAKAAAFVEDKKTGKHYKLGEGKWYKTKNYPKNLLEKVCLPHSLTPRYEFHYDIPYISKEQPRIEKTKGLFGKKREVSSPFCAAILEREHSDLASFWKIEGLNLYTAKAADFIRDKATKKEYRRGEIVLFSEDDSPSIALAEHTDNFEFIYEINEQVQLTKDDVLREAYGFFIGSTIFGKK